MWDVHIKNKGTFAINIEPITLNYHRTEVRRKRNVEV